jgi:hypothetical protein
LVEALEFFLPHFFLGGSPHGRVVGCAVFDHVPEDSCQFMGHGGDGFGCAQSRLPSPETIAQVIFGAP